jgi:hypothetical protein
MNTFTNFVTRTFEEAHVSACLNGGPCRTRTYNQLIKSARCGLGIAHCIRSAISPPERSLNRLFSCRLAAFLAAIGCE